MKRKKAKKKVPRNRFYCRGCRKRFGLKNAIMVPEVWMYKVNGLLGPTAVCYKCAIDLTVTQVALMQEEVRWLNRGPQ